MRRSAACCEGVVVTIVLTAVTSGVFSLLAIDEDDSWYRHVVRRQARRRGGLGRDRRPRRAVPRDRRPRPRRAASARSPTATRRTWRRWLRAGSHRLRRWETDWSSQTGACQAGLLHGSNEDMPAFRWWEKERGAAIVTNHPRDAEELERRHSDGRGLLHADGASRANILSGDAPHSMLTMSTALQPPPADRPRLRGLLRPPLRRRPHARPRPRRHRSASAAPRAHRCATTSGRGSRAAAPTP